MDWNLIIDVISNLIKDEGTREQIYKRFLEVSDYSERKTIEEECLGYDTAFDSVWEDSFAEENEEIDDDEGDGYDYDDE